MTGLKDRQRLALYVALGLSAGSGLTLDASTAYAHDLSIPADDETTTTPLYANGVAMGATNDNKLTIGAAGGDPTAATPMEHPVIGKDVVGGIANDAYGNDIIIESIKAVDAGYGRVYGAHAAGTVEGNSIKFNGGVVNEPFKRKWLCPSGNNGITSSLPSSLILSPAFKDFANNGCNAGFSSPSLNMTPKTANSPASD